jgi:hypothetical protein
MLGFEKMFSNPEAPKDEKKKKNSAVLKAAAAGILSVGAAAQADDVIDAMFSNKEATTHTLEYKQTGTPIQEQFKETIGEGETTSDLVARVNAENKRIHEENQKKGDVAPDNLAQLE